MNIIDKIHKTEVELKYLKRKKIELDDKIAACECQLKVWKEY